MPKTKKSNDVDPAFPDFGHHRVECVTAVPRPARFTRYSVTSALATAGECKHEPRAAGLCDSARR